MSYLPNPFGLKLPGTDGFSLPPGAVPGGPLPPAPLPPGMVDDSLPPQDSPPPSLPPPAALAPPPPPQAGPTPQGAQFADPANSSLQPGKKGLGSWLPLILGTLGGGLLAGKNKALTDFGVGLLQGATDQAFSQSEEKRKRQFELDTANLKQGQEVIKDLMSIPDDSLSALEEEIGKDPNFGHLKAYIRPLREAKQKYIQATLANSDGGTKITAKEAAELANYYNSVKQAKEAINKYQEGQVAAGLAGAKTSQEQQAKYQSLVDAYVAAGGSKENARSLFKVYGQQGLKDLSPKQLQDNIRLAQWYAAQQKLPSWEAVHSSPLEMKRAELAWEVAKAGGTTAARTANLPPSFGTINISVPGGPDQIYKFDRRDPSGKLTSLSTPEEGKAIRFESLPEDASRALTGMHQLASAYQKVDELAKKYPNLFSPGGKLASLDLDHLGGYLSQTAGLSPDEAAAQAELKNSNIQKIFSEAGKTLTGTEKNLVSGLLVQPGDSLLKAKANAKAFLDRYREYLKDLKQTHPKADPTIFKPVGGEVSQAVKDRATAAFQKAMHRPPSPEELDKVIAQMKNK